MSLTRRQFLGASAAALAAGAAAKRGASAANDRVRCAVAGLNIRGGQLIPGINGLDGAEVVALCDPDKDLLEEKAHELEEETGQRPAITADLREIMADDDVDAVFLCTPNHWHSLGAVWACEAGKDVFVEKPISHNLWEGRQVVAAAEQYGRVVQHGTQRRSNRRIYRAMERIRNGEIGDVYMMRCIVYGLRGSIGYHAVATPPPELDWRLWQGPAPEQPYRPVYVHYNWHWFWDWGNGDLGNNAVHFSDLLLWATGKTLPERVYSIGGRFGYDDQGETPNTQICNLTYGDGTIMTMEVRNRGTHSEGGVNFGVMFYGSEGYAVDTDLYDHSGSEIPDPEPEAMDAARTSGSHLQDFIDCVRSRDMDAIPAKALDGHYASAVCHLSNIAYRLGRELRFDPETETFPDDEQANALLRRQYRPGFEVPELTA